MYERLGSTPEDRRDIGINGRSQPCPLAANQRADRVEQPGAIIPPVLESPQATWRQAATVGCGDARRSTPRVVRRHMPLPRVFNPDDYLWTSKGRVYTEERNAAAWEQLYAELESLLGVAGPDACFFVVMGVQGGGKTTWIRNNYEALGGSAVFLDAALPGRRHRTRALALARRFSVRTVAVWIKTPLERALRQNAQRSLDEVVPEFAVRSVFGLLEAPTIREGFHEVIVVNGSNNEEDASDA